MYILARLNLAGQCILGGQGISRRQGRLDTRPFKAALEKKKAAGKSVKAAMTFPGGTHDLWIRYWLAAGGIDPDRDIETIVVPPPQMVANMKVGTMDCFCVCEPWNEQLITQGIGYTALTTGELWKDHPRRRSACAAAWVDKNPNAAKALLMAVMEDQQWCDKPENRDELAGIVAKRQWIKRPGRRRRQADEGRVRLRRRPQGRQQPAHHEEYWADDASYPTSRTTCGSSPRTSAGASSIRRPTQGADREGQPRGPVGATRP